MTKPPYCSFQPGWPVGLLRVDYASPARCLLRVLESRFCFNPTVAVRRIFLTPLFILAVLSWMNDAIARTHFSLIVAVSEYPNLPEVSWLSGPKNDAALVRDFLLGNKALGFKPETITVLANGIDGVQEPTLDAIRTEMRRLADTVEPGDFVYLHFAGHGTQAPALDPSSELDGLDELFLPADISDWNPETRTIKNALVDDEIGAMISKIRDGGADVWAVFDSCHSGTVTRAVSFSNAVDREISRRLEPAVLGLSEAVMESARPKTRGGPVEERTSSLNETGGRSEPVDGRGGFVAFYAAQTNEETPELRLPRGMPGRKTHGLFGFSLFETLAQNPALSYRQLGQEILRKYSVANRAKPTPLFEGDLDKGIFGQDVKDLPQQWPIRMADGKITIPAGWLHGLQKHDELIVMETAIAAEGIPNLKLKVVSVNELSASLESVSTGFTPLQPEWFARKLSSSVDFNFRLALPDAAGSEKLAALFQNLQSLDQEGLRLQVVEPDTNADIHLVHENGSLWFVADDGVIVKEGQNKTISVRVDGRTAEEATALVGDTLARMARVTNLIRLGKVFRPSTSGLDVELTAQNPATGELKPLSTLKVSQVVPGEIVFITARNTETVPLDLNVLYVGSDYSISFIHNARIGSGGVLNLDLFDVTDSSFGRERILLVTTPARPQSATEDLSWLAQPELQRSRAELSQSVFKSVLAEAGFGKTTRGAARRTNGTGGGAISQVLLEVVAR